MKKVLTVAAALALLMPGAASAGDISTAATYTGPTQGIGVGFYTNVGVGLPTGQTCHNSQTVVLLTSNPHYSDILAVLLSAEAYHSTVRFYLLGSVTTNLGGFGYCTIMEASFGNFPAW